MIQGLSFSLKQVQVWLWHITLKAVGVVKDNERVCVRETTGSYSGNAASIWFKTRTSAGCQMNLCLK